MKTLRHCLPALMLLSLAACAPPAPDVSRASNPASTRAAQGAMAAGEPAAVARSAAPALRSAASEPSPVELAAVRAQLKLNDPDIKIDELRGSPLPGIYEVRVGMNFGYVTADGRYLIAGDLSDLKTNQEITEDRRRDARVALIDGLYQKGFIEFAPENQPAKYTVTVFTDVDCGYCRRLHSQIKDYNDRGIAVRYVFFPRTGPDTPSFYKAEEVWCSADRKAALTQAKTGTDLRGDRSCPNPVMDDLKAAAALGLRGTPSIILPDGALVFGYQGPQELLQTLQKTAGSVPVSPAG